MLMTALVVFAITAAGGLLLALYVLRDRLAPWVLSILHALLGATGLVLLLLAVLDGSRSALAIWALLLFAVAAVGGFVLAFHHARQRLPQKAIVALHAAAAVVAFGLLAAVVVA